MRRRGTGHRRRVRVALVAVGSWWSAAAFAIAAWVLLNRAASGGGRVPAMVGIWLAGFAALASIAGWVASIGSVVRDRGRIRVGAVCLLVLPVLGAGAAWLAVSSTVLNPNDPLGSVWIVLSGILLLTGSLLIVPPEHLGTD